MPIRLKGEGAANRVYEYHSSCGQEAPFARVIRVRKRNTNDDDDDDDDRVQALEKEVWSDIVQSTGGLNTPEADLWFIENIIKPVIGGAYIVPKVVIKLTEEEQTIYSGEGRMTGILMPDATLFPSNDSLPLECVCVEIKPKYGGITRCDTISPINRKIKRSNSRYRLHQYLKLSQGRIAEASSYDPQDLFSGNSERIKSALMSLLTNPQNNFALFINGKRVSLESGLSQAASILFDAKINGSENSSNISLTVSLLLMNILMQEHILLERILRLQMSCRYDIEGVFRLYRRLLALENNDVGEMDEGSCATQPDDCQRRALSKLLRLSKPESIAVLRSYCLATTAKDCSLMITVAKNVSVENPNLNRCQSPGWSLHSCGQLDVVLNGVTNSFLYKISLVDMDRKPLSKIPIHMELDEEIMKAARCFV